MNLRAQVLILITGVMALILVLSAYLHQLITRQLIEEDAYNSAVSRTVGLAGRIAALHLLDDQAALDRELHFARGRRQDVEQIDVFRPSPARGPVLASSTVPEASRLPILTDQASDNDLHEMEKPQTDVVTIEVVRGGTRHWIISVAIHDRSGIGYVTSLVRKTSDNPYIGSVQLEHNLVLTGAIGVCLALFYFLVEHFFRRPARDLVRAMVTARGGDLSTRASILRQDELGDIARGFNDLMTELSARERERDELLTRISRFNDELRAEVSRATVELREANETLIQSQQRLARSERLAAMGQVAASLAHEIGTPLNSISGHVNLLARRLPDDGDAQRRAGIINQQLDSIVSSVRALLQRTHKPVGALAAVDLNLLIGEIVRLVSPTLEAHGVRVATALAPKLPPVRADRDRVHQVLLNLVNNSVDAMPGGGELRIVTGRDPATGAVEVIVEDSGRGIAAADFDHLFEPMWTTKPTGSGFGLAISREILQECGGDIDADRDVARGARFRLHLPTVEAAQAAGAAP